MFEGKENKWELPELDVDVNSNKSRAEPELEAPVTQLTFSVTVDKSFNILADHEDEVHEDEVGND